jgi:hypothetical protein
MISPTFGRFSFCNSPPVRTGQRSLQLLAAGVSFRVAIIR